MRPALAFSLYSGQVDDENKLRAIFDMGSNEGALTWTNTGSLGGGGDLKLTARMKLDK